MKGDFTRFTFSPAKRYDAVLTQQGRVQTDADWNEQVMIAAYRNRTQVLDIIGPTGAPQDPSIAERGSFLVFWDALGAKLWINHGRYYVDGAMVESDAPVLYAAQPGAALPPAPGAGTYLLYLDVWRRHITSLEDPGIREMALAGADSGTRSQIVWQARLQRVGDLSVDLARIDPATYGPSWQPAGTRSTGALDVAAGSTPLENQLYRVEIHRGGSRATASFKWSRDNGTVVAKVLTHSPPVETTVTRNGAQVTVWQLSITVDQTGRDSFSSFLPGHMVELSNEELILQRKPGVFGSVTSIAGDTLNLEVPRASAPLADGLPDVNPLAGRLPTVRRWDNPWNPDLESNTLENAGPDYTQNGRLLLERDVTVRFTAETASHEPASYQTGDYWLIPARTASGLEGWVAGTPQPPAGELHSYAPLALVKLLSNGTLANPATDLRDVRDVFPTLRSLVKGMGSIVQGTGTKDRLPKWHSTGGAMLDLSSLTDNGTTVTIQQSSGEAAHLYVTGTTTLGSTLKVGDATDSVSIKRFTSSDIRAMSAQERGETVPTSEGVFNAVNGAAPPGTVVAYAGEAVPTGWLECNGAMVDGLQYPSLFAAIGKAFGAGNGSTTSFNLPDLRGQFVRGWNHGAGVDPEASSRVGGDRVGSSQTSQLGKHKHPVSISGGTSDTSTAINHYHKLSPAHFVSTEPRDHETLRVSVSQTPADLTLHFTEVTKTDNATPDHAHSVNADGETDELGGAETRPRNIALMYIIKS